MDGAQHKIIAQAVADALGLEDATILVLASAYPDRMRTEDSREEFTRLVETGIYDSADSFPARHNSPLRVVEIRNYLWAARSYHLDGNAAMRDKWLGIALHFIADAMSPYVAADSEDRREFEMLCGLYTKPQTFAAVEPGEEIPPHDVADHICQAVETRPSHQFDLSSAGVQQWLAQVYLLSLYAAQAIYAPQYHPPFRQRIDQMFQQAVAKLQKIEEAQQRDKAVRTQQQSVKAEAAAKKSALAEQLSRQKQSLAAQLTELDEQEAHISRELEQELQGVGPGLSDTVVRRLAVLVYLLFSTLVLGLAAYTAYSFTQITQADPSSPTSTWAGLGTIVLVVLAIVSVLWGRPLFEDLASRVADFKYELRRRRVSRPLALLTRQKEQLLDAQKNAEIQCKEDVQSIDAETQQRLGAILSPYDRRRAAVRQAYSQEVEEIIANTPPWYLPPTPKPLPASPSG